MILNKRETTVAYRCPACGFGIISLVGVFSLSADMMKLRCPCGESELVITYTKDRKIRLSVPCLFCRNPHNYMINSSLFFGGELFVLSCAYSAVDICFIGGESDVSCALSKSERELLALLQEAGIESLDALKSDDERLPDAQIFDIVLFIVRELEAEGKISCNCENGRYDVEIQNSGIRVFCKNCNAEQLFAADSVSSAHEFLHCDKLILS